ncbi:Choline/ethanolaminephosphotransferase 1 [Linum perenne]
MLLMGSKHGELTLPVHWASCLTMDVMLLHVHYFTNTLILPVVNGPTEGLMLIYLAYFFTAIVGAEWWSQDFGQCLPIVSWVPFVSEVPTFKAVLYLMIAFAVIPTIGSNVMNVNKVVQARKGGISMALALAMISYIFRLIPDLSLHGADGWHPGLGLFVTIRRNGKLSSFSCSGNLTSIWLSCVGLYLQSFMKLPQPRESAASGKNSKLNGYTAYKLESFWVLVVENGSKNFSGQQLKLLDDDDR